MPTLAMMSQSNNVTIVLMLPGACGMWKFKRNFSFRRATLGKYAQLLFIQTALWLAQGGLNEGHTGGR
jgi:hypothetical protein